MSERGVSGPEEESLPAESKEAFLRHSHAILQRLEDETDPGVVDVEANELLLLAAAHQEFKPFERLRQMASVSHFAMIYLRRFSESVNRPELARHAELIHGAYEQVFGQSMVELAKLGDIKSGPE